MAGPSGNESRAFFISNMGHSPRLTANLLYCEGTAPLKYGVYEDGAGSAPDSLHNNAIVGCDSGVYFDADGGVFRNSEVDLNNSANINGGAAGSVSGNIIIADPATVGFGGDSGYALTVSSPLGLVLGGPDTSGPVCGPGQDSNCGEILEDFNQDTRSVPYSIGAFEY